MEFLVLGPLEVRHDGQTIELRGSKRRALLALLILHANEVVRTDRLVDELWGESPPENAAAALQSHVSRLRKALGSEVLVTKPWGYVLRADPETIDLVRFEALVAEARTLAAQERRERLRDALALWRGAALADLAAEPALVTEVARLDELRLSALEQRIDTDLELGGEPGLVAELEALVAKHPLRERLRGQLILALYRAGRQAEALEAYRETRRVLVEELGIEPSPELRELEQAILRQDPALAVPPPPPVSPPPPGEESRWRWPRSPLAIAAGLVFLGAIGAGTALLVSGGGPSESGAAEPLSGSSSTAHATTTTTSRPVTTTKIRPEEPPPPKHGHGQSHQIVQATTAEVTVTHERPAEPPPPLTTTQSKPATTQSKPATTQTTTRAQAQRDLVYWLEDGFEDAARDFAMWHLSTSTDASAAVQRNGRLELSVDGSAEPGVHYGTQCSFGDDFDARVEYQLLDWPAKNGINVFLKSWFQGDELQTFVGRTGQYADGSGAEAYTTGLRRYGTAVQTGDTSGALRVARVDGNISTYYRYKGTWVRLGTRYERGVVLLLIGIESNSAWFGHQPAVVAFDNFRATAPEGSVDCEGVPYPPRKPAP